MVKLKTELDRLKKLGVKRRIMALTEFCAPINVVSKNGDKVKTILNWTDESRENVHYIVGQLSNAKIMSKHDANTGFHQIKLSSESQLLTTFITPYGKCWDQRLQFGINSGPEHFLQQISQLLEDLSGVICLMDGILVCGESKQEHD